jgi:hypothetical protein
VEGLHIVGDIFTKISVNCVLNYMLHYYVCIYFYGFFLCVCACVFLLLFCMNLCICRVSICFNFVYSSKILCGIAQLDVGDATCILQHYVGEHVQEIVFHDM